MEDKGNIWSRAAKDGLILAAVTVVTTLLGGFCKIGFLNILLWMAKLAGSIMILRAAMIRFGHDNGNKPTFGYGFKVCLCSSIVCAAWTFVMYELIFPDVAVQAFDEAIQMIGNSGQMTDELADLFYKLQGNYAKYSSVAIFVWAVLLGLIFSAIISESTRNKDIFAQDNDNDEGENKTEM